MKHSTGRAQLAVEPLEDRLTPVTVRFDFSLDTSGMFADATRRAALDRVAEAITARMTDSLSAITPSGVNSWSQVVYDSASGSTKTIPNPTVTANEVVVFITGGNLGGALGVASGGAYSARGSQAWLDSIRTRGQGGVDQYTDFSTWGGLIAFNTGVNWDWSAGTPGANQYDIDSVALHEMMHIFGFGLENPSFTRNIANGSFVGTNSVSVYGGSIPMQAGDDPDHFVAGTRYGGQEAVMNPAISAGSRKIMTELEYANLQDVGWGSSTQSNSPPTTPAPVSTGRMVPTPTGTGRFTIGNGAGTAGQVTGYGKDGQPVYAAANASTAGSRVATADVNGDGTPDYVTGSGPGVAPVVTVANGKDGSTLFTFKPFEDHFDGGVYVASADMTGDGKAEIVVGAGEGGGPRVKVYDGAAGGQLGDFWGIEDRGFNGGVRVALGDLNRDGRADLVCAAGEGGGPRVAGYDARSIKNGAAPTRLFDDFYAFETSLANGCYVAVGDFNNDGIGDLVCGAGEGGAPRVTVFNGKSVLAGNTTTWLANFYAGDPNLSGGVRVAVKDTNADGKLDLITAPAPGADGTVRVYAASSFSTSMAPTTTMSVTNPEWMSTGAYVG